MTNEMCYEMIRITESLIKSKISANSLQSIDYCYNTKQREMLIRLAREHKLGAVCKLLGGASFICDPNDHLILQNEHASFEAFYWRELIEIITLLEKQNFDYAVVKGIPLSFLIYEDPYLRGIGDIDIVVPEPIFDKVFYLFLSKGYYRVGAKNLRSSECYFGVYYHEITLAKKVDCFTIYVEIKKHTSCTSSFEKWWPHITSKTINGLTLRVLESEFEILHLFLNTYHNNESVALHQNCRLRDYFDVAYTIKNIEFSLETVLNFAETIQVTHQVAAVLRSVKDIYSSVAINVDPILSLIEQKYCQYQQVPFYYGADKHQSTNYGLVENRPRAALSYSVFDKDFSTYQLNKSYKAVIYSKKNPDYVQRQFLRQNESTPFYEYENRVGIYSKYRFYREGDRFIVLIDINNACASVFMDNKVSINVTLYNNDINSPTMYTEFLSPPIKNLEEVVWSLTMDGVRCKEFYFGDEYLRIMAHEPILTAHIYTTKFNEYTQVIYSFDQKNLFFPLDVLLAEVKFVFTLEGDEDEITVAQGTREHFIECVD